VTIATHDFLAALPLAEKKRVREKPENLHSVYRVGGKELAVFALMTGVNHRVAAFGYRGGSFFDRRDFSMAGTLVKHPKGDLLIDTGFGRHIDEQFRTMPVAFRAITSYSLWQPATDQLKATGYDPHSLHAILLTHSHWDHVSGLPDFPEVPVWITAQEHEFIRKSGRRRTMWPRSPRTTAERRACRGARRERCS
jgi:glyoxylase-like metal-dependent hydrolase (beta-lactamase superfamily II)